MSFVSLSEGEDCHKKGISTFKRHKDRGRGSNFFKMWSHPWITHIFLSEKKWFYLNWGHMSAQFRSCVTSVLALFAVEWWKLQKAPLPHPCTQLVKMTTERQQEGKAITNIHQNYREDEAIHSRGREEKYHQYLTLFYGEATWFRPRSCAGDQQQSITIDKICVHGRPSHFVSLCPAYVELPPQRSQSQSLVSAPSSPWLLGIITLRLTV